MSLLTRLYNFTANQVMRASQFNAEYNQILNVINGNIDNDNIADNSVDAAKLNLSGDTADTINYALTTATRVYAHSEIEPIFTGGIDVLTNYSRPAAADGNGDEGYIAINNVSVGSIITQIEIDGLTQAGSADNSVVAHLERRLKSASTWTNIATVDIDNGDTNDTTSSINHTVLVNNSYRFRVVQSAENATSVDNSKLYSVTLQATKTDMRA